MTASVVGSPLFVANGSNYTAGSGSNRVVVFFAMGESASARTLNSLSFGGVATVDASAQAQSAAGVENVACRYILEANIPSGAQAVSPTWSGTVNSGGVICYTLQDVDQSSPIDTSGVNDNAASATSIAISGGLNTTELIVAACIRNFSTTSETWTSPLSMGVNGSSGSTYDYSSGHGTGTGAATPVSLSWTTSREPALVAVAFRGSASSTLLVVADASHGHAVDAPSLTQANTLAVADALHAHAADNLDLSVAATISVADAAHAHTVDNIDLQYGVSLTVAEALHAHSVDSPSLTQASSLTVAEALHAHSAEAPSLTQANTLAVADAAHAHNVDAVSLTQANTLAVSETSHAHSADSLTLSQGLTLAVADALHAHGVDNLDLIQGYLLIVADAAHAHLADAVVLSEAATLVVNDALHAHLVGLVGLQFGGVPYEPTVFVIRPQSRRGTVKAHDRTFAASAQNRTFRVH